MLTILLLQAVLGQNVPAPDSAAAPVVVPSAPDSAPVGQPPAAMAPEPPPPPAPSIEAPLPPPAAAPAAPLAPALPAAVVRELGDRPVPREGEILPPPPTAIERFGAWQIGAAAGGAGAYGVSLRRWIGGFDAIQINCAPYLHRENVPGNYDRNDLDRDLDSGFRFDARIAVGLTWLHSHAERDFLHGRLGVSMLSYVATGARIGVSQQQLDHIVTDSDNKKSVVFDDYYRLEREFQLGLGGGTEFQLWRVSAYGLLGVQGWYDHVSEDFGVRPDGQLGMHYRF